MSKKKLTALMVENIAKSERRRMTNNISALAGTRENTTLLKTHLLVQVAKNSGSENKNRPDQRS